MSYKPKLRPTPDTSLLSLQHITDNSKLLPRQDTVGPHPLWFSIEANGWNSCVVLENMCISFILNLLRYQHWLRIHGLCCIEKKVGFKFADWWDETVRTSLQLSERAASPPPSPIPPPPSPLRKECRVVFGCWLSRLEARSKLLL
jgi:hypothetical protein